MTVVQKSSSIRYAILRNKNSKTFRSSTVSCRNHSFNIHTQNVKDIVTVTGGSGFLGQHIIRTLQERADYVSEIRVLDIVPYKNLLGHRETKPVIMYQGSVTDRQTTTTAFCGATSVIHVAGLISFGTFPDVSAMKRINIDGTGNVIQTCLECNVERLVFCSSVDVVIGHKEIDHGNETLRIPKKFLFPGYPKTKFKAERLVRMASGETCKNGSHLRTISLRANVMYGELDPYYVTNGLQSAKDNRGILYQVGDGRSQFQQTYVGNTAWAFVCADKALKKNAINSGEFFFVPDNTPIQNTFQFMEIFLKGRNYKLSKYKIPFSIVYYPVLMLEWFLHVLSPLVRIYLPIVSCSIKYINMNLHFSGKKARERLGYHPIYKPNESIEKCLDFYQNVKLK